MKKKTTYKGFDKEFKCRDFQYEVGKTYTHKGTINICNSGFHSCENPLDIFNYYLPSTSRFGECEISGKTYIHDSDSKVVSSKISVKSEINLFKIIKLGVEYILSKVDFKNNKESNTGNQSAATNTGNYSAATVEGKESIAIVTGKDSKAKGKKGCWLVLTERNIDYKILGVR